MLSEGMAHWCEISEIGCKLSIRVHVCIIETTNNLLTNCRYIYLRNDRMSRYATPKTTRRHSLITLYACLLAPSWSWSTGMILLSAALGGCQQIMADGSRNQFIFLCTVIAELHYFQFGTCLMILRCTMGEWVGTSKLQSGQCVNKLLVRHHTGD